MYSLFYFVISGCELLLGIDGEHGEPVSSPPAGDGAPASDDEHTDAAVARRDGARDEDVVAAADDQAAGAAGDELRPDVRQEREVGAVRPRGRVEARVDRQVPGELECEPRVGGNVDDVAPPPAGKLEVTVEHPLDLGRGCARTPEQVLDVDQVQCSRLYADCRHVVP